MALVPAPRRSGQIRRVVYRRDGGFMALHRGCELECGSMPVDELEQMQALLSAAQQQLDARARPKSAVPVDAIHHSIEVDREGIVETLEIGDADRTDEIAALLAFLEQRSGPRQRS